MIRPPVWLLSLIRRIDPGVARRVSRGWGWHLVFLAAGLYIGVGFNIRESIDNFVLFLFAVSGAALLMYHLHQTFITRPAADAEEWRWVEYRLYRVLLMCSGVLSVGMFF